MIVFVDFEASSLARNSYPIEVGWVFEDGRGEAHLIRPAPDWTDWDTAAEAIHGIRRETLEREGVPHDEVARLMTEALDDHQLHASAPSWDGKWLSVLLRAAGLPRHALRLRDTDEAQRAAALEGLRPRVPADALDAAVEALIALEAVRRREAPPAHRALADAQAERQHWLAIRTAAATHQAEPGPLAVD